MKYRKNADRVQQAIDIGKLAAFGGVAYVGYKIYEAYMAYVKKEAGLGPIPALVKPNPEVFERQSKEILDSYATAGYITKMMFDGDGGKDGLGGIKGLLEADNKSRISGKGRLMSDEAHDRYFKFIQLVEDGKIELIDNWTAEKPDPRILADRPVAQNRDNEIKQILAAAIKTETVTKTNFDKLEALRAEVQPILKKYYEYKNAGKAVPEMYNPNKLPISIKVLQMTQTFLNETKNGRYMLDEQGNKKFIKIVEA